MSVFFCFTLPAGIGIYWIASALARTIIQLLVNYQLKDMDIDKLVEFAKVSGGIEYAERRMWDFHAEAQTFLDKYVKDDSIRSALQTYLDYVIKRKK